MTKRLDQTLFGMIDWKYSRFDKFYYSEFQISDLGAYRRRFWQENVFYEEIMVVLNNNVVWLDHVLLLSTITLNANIGTVDVKTILTG